MLTQSELIDLCELYDNDIRDTIKTNYELTHPLLKQILTTSEKHVQNNNTKINYLSFH